MSSPHKQPPQKRAYPPIYEKIVPIALVLIGFVPLYGWFSSRVDRLRLIVGVTLFFAVNLELFYLGFVFRVAGQVDQANIAATTATDDSAIPDIDPDWPHSWFSIQPASSCTGTSRRRWKSWIAWSLKNRAS